MPNTSLPKLKLHLALVAAPVEVSVGGYVLREGLDYTREGDTITLSEQWLQRDWEQAQIKVLSEPERLRR